jgi:hypothetical protein
MSVLNKEEQILFLFLQFPLRLFLNSVLYLHCHVEKESGSYRDINLIAFVSWIFYINRSDNNLIKFRNFLI